MTTPLERARAEMLAVVRLAGALGLALTLGAFALIALKMQVYALVLPTGGMGTLAGLAAGFALGASLLVALEQVRELALLALGHRLARALAAPAVLAAAEAAAMPRGAAGVEPGVAATGALADVEALRRGATGPLCAAALDALMLPAMLLLLLGVHWWFAAFGLLCCAVAAGIGAVGERLTRGALAEANEAAARSAGLAADAMRCAEAVAAMGMLPDLVRRWRGGIGLGAGRLRAAQGGARLVATAASVLHALAAGGALVLGAALALRGEDLGAGLMVAMLLTGRLVEPFLRLGAVAEDWAAALAAWRRLRAAFDAAAPARGGEARAFPCPAGRLVAERATLLVPGSPRPLLREIGLVVAPGDAVAVVGPAGCGKSTLLRLLLGLRRPTAGGVFLDGHATWQWDREALARHVGYLPQEPLPTEGTVAEAIARLDAAPDMRAVMRAARLAGADRMIAALPQGYATPAGAEFRLSMGQRQRIALARAVYGAPRLVLLDEPAAWLDEEGEAAVLRLIGSLRAAGVGVVFTTHRPALLRAADRVLTLRDGVLAPVGARQALLPRPAAAVAAVAAPAAAIAAPPVPAATGAPVPAAPVAPVPAAPRAEAA